MEREIEREKNERGRETEREQRWNERERKNESGRDEERGGRDRKCARERGALSVSVTAAVAETITLSREVRVQSSTVTR